jgi:transcriptional regulator with XRE-family HTH domain
MSELAKILKKAKYQLVLEDNSFTMQKLAKISGIKVNVLNTIFYQGYVPSAKVLLQLAKFLNIGPVHILHVARKLTPEMEDNLFTWKMICDLYESTYGIDVRTFPDVKISDTNEKEAMEGNSQ